MSGMWKHIDDAGCLERITPGLDQRSGISCQRPRMTGHVNDSAGTNIAHSRDYCCGPASRRVQQYPVPAGAKPGFAAVHLAEIGTTKLAVVDAVVLRVVFSPLHLVHLTLNAKNPLCASRHGQRKITNTAIKIEDAVLLPYLQQADRLEHHASIHATIDLHEIGCIKVN